MQNILEQLLVNVPVWAILLFFIYRGVKSRDSFENSINAKLASLEISVAVLKHDSTTVVEFAKLLSVIAGDNRDNRKDIDAFYSRLRDLENRAGSN
jgi:hypothetical protein